MTRSMPWPSALHDAPSSSHPPVARAASPSGLSSPSDDVGSYGEGDDICTVVWQLDVTTQALHDESREVKRLRACLSAAETALGAVDQETAVARAAATVAQAELTGKMISPASHLACNSLTLIQRVFMFLPSQPCRNSCPLLRPRRWICIGPTKVWPGTWRR